MAKNNRTKPKNKQKKQQKVVYVQQQAPIPSIGAQIGDGLQKLGTSLFTKWMGSGDYSCNDMCYDVNKNALIKGSDAKAVKMSSDRSTFVFEHSEYVGDVTSATIPGAFKQISYTVNPANSITFPWLSGLANSFESYEIEGMLFRFVSTSGNSVASTNTALGTVMGTFEYDAMDAPFTSKQQLLQYDDTVDCRISQNFICGVECDKSRLPTFSNKLYVGKPPPNADAKLYNYGNFTIATQGVQASEVNIGELWVSYRIKMHITKQLNFVPSSTLIQSKPIADIALPYADAVATGTMNVIVEPAAIELDGLSVGSRYTFTWVVKSSFAISLTPATLIVQGLLPNYFFTHGGSYYVYGSGTSVTETIVTYCFTATSDVGAIDFPYNASTGPFAYDLMINQLDNTIIS